MVPWSRKPTILLFVIALILLACGPTWEAQVVGPDGSRLAVNRDTLQAWEALAVDNQDTPAVPLEQLLWETGHQLVAQVQVTDREGTQYTFDWQNVAGNAWWQHDGRLKIAEQTVAPAEVSATATQLLGSVEASITDIAPTAAAILGIPAPELATGQPLTEVRADHVLLLFLDGFGYVRYTEALSEGLIPNLSALGEPLLALTVYPPCTSVASAALLTGAPPQINGVNRRGIRKTEKETLLDSAHSAGLEVMAVEGNALPFNLRNAQFKLSGDRDGNGSTDDNVLENTLTVLNAGMPDLLYVHFHGIDDAGHSYGPGAPEEKAMIRGEDEALGQIWDALPESTVMIVFADHGMHAVQEEGRLGNHGNLIERDMAIPIWIATK